MGGDVVPANEGIEMSAPPGGGWANPAWGEPAPGQASPAMGAPGAPGQPAGPGQDGLPPGSPGVGYGAYAYGPDPAPQPGVVPLRPLGVGEILDGALTTIRRHPKVTIGLAAIVVTVQQVISVVASYSAGSLGGVLNPDATFGTSAASSLGIFSSVVGLSLTAANFVLGLVLGALLTGALMVVVGQSVLGRPVSLADVWARVKPRFWALLGGSILAGLLPFVGFPVAALAGLAVGLAVDAPAGVAAGVILGVLLLIPGAYIWGVLSLTTPAITLERLGPIRGLRRSFQLARRDFWRVWGIQALSVVIAQFLAGVLVLPFTVVGLIVLFAGAGGDPSQARQLAYLIVAGIGAIVGGCVTEPFLSSVTGLMYIDRRMRGEGFDIALQESQRHATAPMTGGAATAWR